MSNSHALEREIRPARPGRSAGFKSPSAFHQARGLFLAALAVVLFQSAQAQQTLPFYDYFPGSYGDGTALGLGGSSSIWTVGNSTGAGGLTNRSAANQSYAGLVTSGGLGVVSTGVPGSNRDRGVPFTEQVLGESNPTVYVSFLLNIQAGPSGNNRLLAGFRSGTATGGGFTPTLGVFLDPSRQLLLSKNSVTAAAPTTAVLDATTTHLVVVRYKWNSGTDDDEVALWVNPGSLGVEENDVPAASISTVTGTDSTSLGSFHFTVRSTAAQNGGGTYWLDELRIGKSWADVTPSTNCFTAGITSQPADKAGFVGTTATFSIIATGSSRTFQWQISTNSGTDWDNVSTGSGGTTANYSTPALTVADNGNQYRCIVSVACDSSSVTSSVATLTVYDPTVVSFRSATSGIWGAASTWEWSTNNGASWAAAPASPTAGNSTNILLQSGHAVTNLATIAGGVDDLTIEAGGLLVVSGATFAIADGAAAVDCDVSGMIQVNNVTGSTVTANPGAGLTFRNGSSYVWTRADAAAAIPTATWEDGSTCEIQNCTTATPTGLGQSFYDFYWNKTSSGAVSLGGQLTTVRNNLRMRGSSDSANSVRFLATTLTNDLHVGRDVVIEGGFITLSGGSTINTVLNLFVGGNFVIASGATWDSRNSGVGSSANILFTNATTPQVLTNLGAISHTGSGGGCPINWKVNPGVTLTLAGGNIALFTANNSTRDSVTVDGTLQMGTYQFTGPGNLTVNAGGTLVGNGTNQLTASLNAVTYGGTLNLPGLPTLNNGDGFKLFGAAAYGGAFAGIIPATPGAGLVWDTSSLAVDGTLKVAAVPTGQPQFATPVLSGSDLILSGTGGTANGDYYVLTSTNAGLALTNWSVLATNQFDGSGNFVFTNAVSPGVPQQFFVLQVP